MKKHKRIIGRTGVTKRSFVRQSLEATQLIMDMYFSQSPEVVLKTLVKTVKEAMD